MDEPERQRKPVLVAVDADAGALGLIERELTRRYGEDYRVVCADSAEAGLRTLEGCREAGEEVALALADQWLPGTTGIEFLARVRRLHPGARRVLMMAWGAWADRESTDPINRATAFGQVDAYVLKPWHSPDEAFHQAVTGFLHEWTWAHPARAAEVRVVAEPWSPRSHDLRDLLERSGLSHTFYAPDSPEGRALLAEVGQSASRLPVLVLADGQVLIDPTNLAIAESLGAVRELERRDFDVVVIGAGPAGLSAAVYGASEGLRTLILERETIGGQASASSLIRNYLGFLHGISGSQLAREAYLQALTFGARFHFMRHATALRRDGREFVVSLSDGTDVTARAVVLATGVSYRRLGVPGLEALVGTGVFYGAAGAEAPAMAGQEVYVVGGANSAGQAAMYLSKYASRVTLVVRHGPLGAEMSDYLVQGIEATENIAVRLDAEVVDGGGEGRLEHLVLRDRATGQTERVPAAGLFVVIGAVPRTEWLPGEIERDESGYLVAGRDLLRDGRPPAGWPLDRPPLPLETSLPGVFAAGDVRYRATKRVASAVGEGAIAIRLVHEYLGP